MINADQHKEETARKIKILRKLHRFSQSQVSNRLRIPRERYASYESGKAITPYLTIVNICSSYKITMDEFHNLKIGGNLLPKTPNEWRKFIRRYEKNWRLHSSQTE